MSLKDDDARNLVRLVGDVAAVPGGHVPKKQHLMKGLCQLIGADAWAWTLACQRDPDKPQTYVSFQNGGFSDERLTKVLQAVDHPDMVEIASKFYQEIQEKQTHLTRLRYQITNKEDYEKSGAHSAWKAANVGPVIMSLRPLDARSSSVVVFYRDYGREEFSLRESRIAHIILNEVAWLHEQGWPEDRGVDVPKLSKRQRLTLNLLTLGHSRKQIATNLGISLHTTQGYVKDVYRYFHVSSQAELMRRFLQGNGHDAR